MGKRELLKARHRDITQFNVCMFRYIKCALPSPSPMVAIWAKVQRSPNATSDVPEQKRAPLPATCLELSLFVMKSL